MARVVHFEVHADDPDRAIDFYSRCFNWSFTRIAGPMEYWLIATGPDADPGINGGLMRRQGSINGTSVIAYVCTLAVESLAESVTAAEAAGGTVALPRMPVPGVGWLAYMKDPEGNIFGMIESDPAAA